MARGSEEWIKAGSVCVDAGIVSIGDPCYLREGRKLVNETRPHGEIREDHPSPLTDWDDFCQKTDAVHKEGYAKLDWPGGDAVVVSSGVGDGQYNVYVRKDHNGEIAEARIIFIDMHRTVVEGLLAHGDTIPAEY